MLLAEQEQSFATNHMEAGVHIGKGTITHLPEVRNVDDRCTMVVLIFVRPLVSIATRGVTFFRGLPFIFWLVRSLVGLFRREW